MINSNPFLIREQKGTDIQNPTPGQWIFELQENGILRADFLQMDQNLNVFVILNGEEANCQINCAYLVNKNNKININIKVLHKVKNTTSLQQIKGLVADTGQVNFIGTIEIPKNSQKCDGRQTHRAVLLSEKAVVSATPQLEIWADDVQCAHGSAVGPLDKNQLFYLQARGLPPKQARRLLLKSFLGDLMPNDFDAIISKWMDENV